MTCPNCNSANVRTERVPTKPPAEESICGACGHYWRVVVPAKGRKPRRTIEAAPAVSRTAKALELLHGGASRHEAAALTGLAYVTVINAAKRERLRRRVGVEAAP